MKTRDAGEGWVTRLVARVVRFVFAFAIFEAHQKIFAVDELIARIVRNRVVTRVHSDCVARARFNAVATENAAQFINHEAHRVLFVAAARIAFGIFASFDEDALRRARGGTAEARDASRIATGTRREAVNPTEARGVRALLFGVGDRGDAVRKAVENRVGALTFEHVTRVREEVFHRNAEAAENFRQVGLR